MRVEACCQALLKALLPVVDPQREGVCLDVGVGSFAFYCELFAQLGFPTIAVEPLPVDQLRRICQQHRIRLVESCLSDHNGTQNLHIGQFANVNNANFNSLEKDWFGSSLQTQQVSTLTLASLLSRMKVIKLSCLKLDIEGWEPVIIQQLIDLPETQLPVLTMFEYGGGGQRAQQNHGWSPKYLQGTMTCLTVLKQLGYDYSVMIDYAHDAQTKVLHLQSLDLDPNTIFPSNAIYGNMICLRGRDFPVAQIKAITTQYNGGIMSWLVEKWVVHH